MRMIGVVTVGRSDYGIYQPVLRRIQADPDLQLHLIVTGMHLSPEFGLTIKGIEADGFAIGDRVEMLLSSDSPEAIAKSMGLGIIGMAQAYARSQPDILVVLGDRFEMYAAAVAALPFGIPVAHIHGGELTEGAIDDSLRHSISKLSHLHFVAMEEYARRVVQLGEEPWRVTITGAPSIDNLDSIELLSQQELEAKYGFSLDPAPLLVTFHPTTLEFADAAWQAKELLAALEGSGQRVVFTLPNADTGGQAIAQQIRDYVQTHDEAAFIENFGTKDYLSLMRVAGAMVGNSSSGLIEAPSFALPVVNIGTRQGGRVAAANVIHVGYARTEIMKGIDTALRPEFRAGLIGLINPYGNGKAAERIVDVLKTIQLDDALIRKRFHNL